MGQPVHLSLSDASGGAKNTAAQLANYNAQPFQLTIEVLVTGTVNYTVYTTMDDVMGLPNPSSWSPTTPSPTWTADSVLAAQTASGTTTINDPIQAWKVTLNSGTGSLAITGIQAGIRG